MFDKLIKDLEGNNIFSEGIDKKSKKFWIPF